MGKIKKLLNLFVLLFIIFPCIASAGTELGTSTQNPVVGTSVYVQLDANYGKTCDIAKIRDFHVYIEYDPTVLEYKTALWLQGIPGDIRVDKDNNRIYIDKEPGKDWICGALLQLKFDVLADVHTVVNVKRNGDSHYGSNCDKPGGCDVIGQSFGPVNISPVKPSSSTIIKTLEVIGYTLHPTFSKTHYEYNVTVPPEVSSVIVNGTKGDSRQTISGLGTVKLNYGVNTVKVVVSAEDGSSRTYEINIYRKDNRTGDTSLKSLSVSSTAIAYIEGETTYEATVGRSVDNVLITARTNDPNAQMTGTGKRNLNIGKNTFTINVTSTGGKSTTYTIIINRSTEELNTIEASSKLISLKVNNVGLDLSKDKREWLVSVASDYEKLDITPIPESLTGRVIIEGNENLKQGLNVVKITVVETNGDNVDFNADKDKINEYDFTEYFITVYKNPAEVKPIKDLNDITEKTDVIYSTTSGASHIIPKNSVAYLKENNLSLYYNVVNIYNGLLYQLKLSKNLPDTDLDVTFKKISDSELKYETNVPVGTEVLLYLDGVYLDGAIVKIYTIDENGKYSLLTDGIKVNKGYVSFTTNESHNYLITTRTLLQEKGPIEKFFAKYKMYFLGGIVGFILVIFLANQVSKMKAKQESKGPLY